MASSAPTPLRQVLEERVRQLVLETETLFADARDRARRDMADQLNQAVRRIRQTSNLEDLGATLVDATAAFCPAAALFGVSGEMATGERIRGVSEAVSRNFASLEVPLGSAPALAGAVDSRDPVAAATMSGEVSEALVKLLDHGPAGRASIYPLVARDRVVALLYAWGTLQGPAIELLASVASLVWIVLTEPAAPPPAAPQPEAPQPAADGLVAIAPLPAGAPAERKAAASWDELPLEEQRVHLRAQRFARVQVSEMRLFEPDAVQSGRAERNLYHALRTRIDGARGTFHASFFLPCPSMVDYLHLELVRTLANDNPELLGGDYPGPLV
jgi:hypothetical protein